MEWLAAIWRLQQARTLGEQRSDLDAARERLAEQGDEVVRLRRECAALSFTCHALTQLLLDRGVIRASELEDGIATVKRDLARATGKAHCGGCDRVVRATGPRCPYCGAAFGVAASAPAPARA